MIKCDGCQYPLDGKGHAAGCLRDAVEVLEAEVLALKQIAKPSVMRELRAQLFDSTKRADGLEQDVAHWRERAEEREADMHLRIRQGYDKAVADCWRAEVAKVTERAEKAEARVRSIEEALLNDLVSGYGVSSKVLYGENADPEIIDIVTCDCGARVEGQGRDPRKVRLEHRNGCLLRSIGPMPANGTERKDT
jgi:hypothetical protein